MVGEAFLDAEPAASVFVSGYRFPVPKTSPDNYRSPLFSSRTTSPFLRDVRLLFERIESVEFADRNVHAPL